MSELKVPIHEEPLLLLPKNCEVGANFIFYEAKPLKLGVFDRPFYKAELKLVKLSGPKWILSLL
jgi:hypothetical protein